MEKKSSIDRAKITANVFVQSATVFVIVVMLNYLAFHHFKRWDLSRDKRYSLSGQTKRVVANLKQPAKLIFFYADSDVYQDVAALLEEFKFASKRKIEIELVNPYANITRGKEISAKYKLGTQENVVIVDYNGRTKFVSAAKMADYEPALNPVEKPLVTAFKGEQALTSALLEVTEQSVNKIYVLSGHGEASIEGETLTGFKTFLERQNVQLVSLKFSDADAVPDDAKALLIMGPKYDLSDRDLQMLDGYWKRKGRVLALLDPGSPTPKLAGFLEEQGITINNDRVLKTVPLRGFTGVLKEITGDFIPGSPITQHLENVSATFLGVTQSLTMESEFGRAPAGVKLQPLIRASKGFWAEVNYDMSDGHAIYFNPKLDKPTPVVAVSVERGALSDERVHVDSSRLIAIGNSAFIVNEAMTEADLDFLLSGVNWLLDREQLTGITPKPVRNFALSLSENQVNSITLLSMIAIPCSAALLGVIAWAKRRR